MVSVRGIALVFWAPWFSVASTSFSNTFLEALLPAFVYDNIERRPRGVEGVPLGPTPT
jgi:hypothetical protein